MEAGNIQNQIISMIWIEWITRAVPKAFLLAFLPAFQSSAFLF
jgi:hypothetical protein